jgi:hypothetical protein
MRMDLSRIVQIAMIGEVPSTLRFIYASYESDKLWYCAVFTDDALDEHLECASRVLAEIFSHTTHDIELEEMIKRDSDLPWRIGTGEHLMYLRYGELSNT